MPSPATPTRSAAAAALAVRRSFSALSSLARTLDGRITEHLLDTIVAGGLLALLLYGLLSWRASGDAFPADMRRSSLEIRERGFLLAGSLSTDDPYGATGPRAVHELARELDVEVRWVDAPAYELLRRLEADSLDVLAHYGASLPGAEAFGLTRPYAVTGDSRLVLAVTAGENRLLGLADAAVRSMAGAGER